MKSHDRLVYAHQSIAQLELNCDTLGISRDAIKKFRLVQNHYHLFSHPGLVGMASRMDMGEPGQIYIGGNFDAAKLPAYKIEIAERTELCRTLPKIIDGLISRLTT